uniref:Anamorsin homolog n=1 Tax=Kalanchoe fedtschenkoi TaxID=63787 RepID=A0A7N0TB01_KALFE
MEHSILALSDHSVLPVSAVVNALKNSHIEGAEQSDPLIITQASNLSQLSVGTSSVDIVISIWASSEFPLFGEVARVLKPGGSFLIYKKSHSDIAAQTTGLERKLLVSGFVDPENIQPQALAPSESELYIGVKSKKPSWKIGSSFALKKPTKALPKIQIDDDMDLIDEDSLLTEEDLKKPQLPVASDCEVGSAKKACKNCTCGRAEAEEKKVKLELTTEQINNPQSACGSCYLGDAFRCGTCPYKGLPAFKQGEKVTLAKNFLVSDI